MNSRLSVVFLGVSSYGGDGTETYAAISESGIVPDPKRSPGILSSPSIPSPVSCRQRRPLHWAAKRLRSTARRLGVAVSWLQSLRGEDIPQLIREKMMDCSIHRYNYADVRTYWKEQAIVPEIKRTKGHTHVEAAAKRTGSAKMIDQMAHATGRPIYVVSSCAREDEYAATYHGYYIGKDPVHCARRDPIPTGAIIKMVDVDYYIDWKRWARKARPVALYTFVPDAVQFSGPEYDYALSHHGVRMHVNGGSTYVHQLWNYSHDYVSVRTGLWRTVVFAVDSRMVDRHHRVVLLTPVYSLRFIRPPNVAALERMDFSYGPNVSHRYMSEDGVVVSVGTVEQGRAVTSINLPETTLSSIFRKLNHTKANVDSDVEKILQVEKQPNPHLLAPHLMDIYIGSRGIPGSLTTTDRPGTFVPREKRYDIYPDGGLVLETGKPIGRILAPPLVANPDYIPNRSRNNDMATITERVNKRLNVIVPPSIYEQYARDFVNAVVGNCRSAGYRLSLEDVISIQNRPTQLARSERVKTFLHQPKNITVSSFMKGESYGKPAAPRNISTVPPSHTVALSAYTYAFKKQVLQPKDWYMPGKKPAQIAGRVVDLSRKHQTLCETDFTAFDGTISEWLRDNIEVAAYLSWAPDRYKSDLQRLLYAERCPKSATATGLRYDPAHSRLSGSPLTTDGNTLINAFVSYAAARQGGSTLDQAMAALGAYAGDDGLSGVDSGLLSKVSEDLGLILKCEKRHGNLAFLGRVFYDAHLGNIGSIQDPERTWRKLHISFAPQEVPADQALANRAAGYLALDPMAPVTSDWARLVARVTGLAGIVTSDAPYYAQNVESDGTWPQMETHHAVAAIAWRTSRDESDVWNLISTIRKANTMLDIEAAWRNPESEIPLRHVVDGCLRYPPPLKLKPSVRQAVTPVAREKASGHVSRSETRTTSKRRPARIRRLAEIRCCVPDSKRFRP